MQTPRRPLRVSIASVVACAALCAAVVPGVPGGVAVGAAEPSLAFSGRTWTITTSTGLVGPGPNVFAQSNAFVDSSGYLHLRRYTFTPPT